MSNFYSILGEYQYTFVEQTFTFDNENMMSNFTEISLSKGLTLPFETFKF